MPYVRVEKTNLTRMPEVPIPYTGYVDVIT